MFGNDGRWPASALAGGLAVLITLAGCVASSQGHSEIAMGGQTPSGVAPAVAAPVTASPGQPAKTLSSDPLDAPAATSVLDAQRSAEMAEEMSGGGGMEDHAGHGGHGGHGGGTYRQVDAGRGPGAYEGSEKQPPGAGPRQHDSHSHAAGAAPEETAVYTCPMHPEVTGTTPGECPKCGMTLVKRRKG